MWMVVVGVLLTALKFAEIAPVDHWSWWVVLAPFGMAMAWWAFADASGITSRREMDKVELKRHKRQQQAFEAMGIEPETAERTMRARNAARSNVRR